MKDNLKLGYEVEIGNRQGNKDNNFNPNPHWTCSCSVKNQNNRDSCINCGENKN